MVEHMVPRDRSSSTSLTTLLVHSAPGTLVLFAGFSFLFGCTLWLTGSEFPYQGLNPGPHSESAESQPLDRQGIPCCFFKMPGTLLPQALCPCSSHCLESHCLPHFIPQRTALTTLSKTDTTLFGLPSCFPRPTKHLL